MSSPSSWTTPEVIRASVRRRWDDGALLRALARREPFPEISLRVRGPRPSELGDDLGAVQSWVAALEQGSQVRGRSRYTLAYTAVGGRVVGRNSLPHRATLTSYEQAWSLLGVTAEVAAYEHVLELVSAEPRVSAWVVEHPLRALEVAGDWPALLAAYRWLDEQRGSGRYLREVNAPGVDTKFLERRRPLLSALLGSPPGAAAFVAALGLRSKPQTVRLRFGPGQLAMPPWLTEAVLRLDELAAADLSVETAVIIENEITYLSVPVPTDGVVLWGKGFEVDRVASLPWLRAADVHYWGDLDTHGFAILNQLRAWLPQARSFLMDRDTLLAHRARWGREDSPGRAVLDRLTPDEHALYADLVTDRFGDAVRLEQERVDWAWVREHLPAALRGRA
jgi:hypothetical protein